MPELRRIAVSGRITIKDDEVFEDEYGHFDAGGTAVIGADQPARLLLDGSKCVGDEVRFEIVLNTELSTDNNAKITGHAKLFEGSSCNSADEEASQDINLLVPKDGVANFSINLQSIGGGGGDYSRGTITFTNVAVPQNWRSPGFRRRR